ncbi:MAG: F0F1 ATP synthase subunit epsilon [Bacillota bacterium]
MAKTFHLTIAKVGENLFDGEAVSVTLPGEEGVFTVLANHEAFVTPLKAGEAHVETADGKKETFAIERGIAEVSSNQATVLL